MIGEKGCPGRFKLLPSSSRAIFCSFLSQNLQISHILCVDGEVSPIMRLTCQGTMIDTQSYLRPSQGVPCYQWRAMHFDKWSCSLSLVRFRFTLKTMSHLDGFNGEFPVHCSLVHSPHIVSCRQWLGRTVCQSRCGVSSVAGVRRVGIAKSQLGAAETISYEELGRYGIDESDYADVMTSPQRPRISDRHEKTTSNAVSESEVEKDFDVKQMTNLEETKDIQIAKSNDEAKVECSDWWTYFILSNDKRKTYLGVTANVTRSQLVVRIIWLRQHNGEIPGGAKAARGDRPWSLVCTVRGFGNRSEACQFEWRLRKISKVQVYDTLSEEIPTHHQGSHVILRRWAALKKVHEITNDWKLVQVEWY